MFRFILSLGPIYIWAIIFACITTFFLARKALVDYKIRKLGAVRSPVLATNPITGMKSKMARSVHHLQGRRQLTHLGLPFFLDSAWKQMNNKLLDYYESVYRWSTPECPNCVEIAFSGGIRYLITREPEHVKTILTSKFAEYGKGPNFHRVWSPFLGDSIFTTDGQLWSNSRALIRPMFIKERVRDLEIFDRWAQKLIGRIPESGGLWI